MSSMIIAFYIRLGLQLLGPMQPDSLCVRADVQVVHHISTLCTINIGTGKNRLALQQAASCAVQG